MSRDYELANVTLIGRQKAGKSAIRLRAVENQFSTCYESTIGVEFGIIFSKDNKIKFQIWDTSGDEKFAVITNSYLNGARLIGLVVDLTHIDESLSFFKIYRDRIDRIDNTKTECVVIYTKSDLKKAEAPTPEVIENHCTQIAANLGITRDKIKQHSITSAESGEGFDTMIQDFADLVMPPLAPAFNPHWDYAKDKQRTAPTSNRGSPTSLFGKESNNTATLTNQAPPPIEYQF